MQFHEDTTWYQVDKGSGSANAIAGIYDTINGIRRNNNRIAKTMNNNDSSRGHLALSLKINDEGIWHILDMAGSERPIAIAEHDICTDFDKSMSWNQFLREGNSLNDITKHFSSPKSEQERKQIASIIQQGYFINESNNHFLCFLRSRAKETGSVNPTGNDG